MPGRMLNAKTLIFPGIEIVGALIFDFDGVIADSEAIANGSGGNGNQPRSFNDARSGARALFRPEVG